jgi:hypothetical protein
MTPADKYGRAIESLSADQLQQAQAAGQTLAESGVVQQSSLGSGTPAPTPAAKYGVPAESPGLSRSLAQDSPTRSL